MAAVAAAVRLVDLEPVIMAALRLAVAVMQARAVLVAAQTQTAARVLSTGLDTGLVVAQAEGQQLQQG